MLKHTCKLNNDLSLAGSGAVLVTGSAAGTGSGVGARTAGGAAGLRSAAAGEAATEETGNTFTNIHLLKYWLFITLQIVLRTFHCWFSNNNQNR